MNAAALMSEHAAANPDRLVFVAAQRRRGDYQGVSYADFDRHTDALAAGYLELGVEPRMRVALLVHPHRGLFEAGYGLLKAGATPVLIDSGLGGNRIGGCLEEADVGAIVAVPEALMARRVFRWSPDARVAFTTGAGRPGLPSLAQVARLGRRLPAQPDPGDGLAAIAFTSGSTGPPKGVEYTHAMFLAQARMIADLYEIPPGEVNVATFGPFALLGPLLGMTTVLPRMDFSNPGSVDPERVIEVIAAFEATMMFGSPALLDTLGRYGEQHGVRLPTLRRVLSAGAPVRPDISDRFLGLLSEDTHVHTPYGATEALPVASIDSTTLRALYSSRADGICVGAPVDGVEVTLIPITDGPVTAVEAVPAGDAGEIVVKGPIVSSAYHRRPVDNVLAKISWDGHVAHRMGDIGRFDPDGRLWFLGRKSHRVLTTDGDLFPIPVEAAFNRHAAVARSALIGLGSPPNQRPVIVVEVEKGRKPSDQLATEILEVAAQVPGASRVTEVLFHDSFPVDVRHNSKIDRPALADWAARKQNR